MESVSSLGRIVVLLGLGMVGVGLILIFVGRVPYLGRLPGDIVYRKGSFTFYFPLATSLLLSIFLTLLFWLLRK